MAQNKEEMTLILEELVEIFETQTKAENEASVNSEELLAAVFERTQHYDKLLKSQTQLVIGAKGTGKSFLSAALRLDLGGYLKRARTDKQPKILAVEAVPGSRPGLITNLRELFTLANKYPEVSFSRFWDWFVLWRVAQSIVEHVEKIEDDKTREQRLKEARRILGDLGQTAGPIVGTAFPSGSILDGGADDSLSSAKKGLLEWVGNVLTGYKIDKSAASPIPARNLDDIRIELADFVRTSHVEIWVLFDRLDEIFLFDATEAHARSLTALFQSIIEQYAVVVPWKLKIFIRPDVMGKLGKTVNFDSLVRNAVRLSWNNRQIIQLVSKRLSASAAFRELHKLESGQVLPARSFSELFDNCSNLLSTHREDPVNWITMITGDGLNSRNPRNLLDLVGFAIQALQRWYEDNDTHAVSNARRDAHPSKLLFFNAQLNEAYMELSKNKRDWLENEFKELNAVFSNWKGTLVARNGFSRTDFAARLETIEPTPRTAQGDLSADQILEILEQQAGFIRRYNGPGTANQVGDDNHAPTADYVVAPVYRHSFGAVVEAGQEAMFPAVDS